jgi:hypothetical protein
VSSVTYELSFISQKTTFFIITAVKTSNLTVAFFLGNSYSVVKVSCTSTSLYALMVWCLIN